MLAMQYTIRLPLDYDLSLIHKRVSERTGLFENLPGLVHKSYLLNAEEKIYAPFYLWNDLSEARGFMLNDLFQGVIKAFSRPRIRSWTVLSHIHAGSTEIPRFALREVDSIAPEENLETMVARETAQQEALKRNKGLHSHAIALDPDRWEILRFSLWKDEAAADHHGSDCITPYEVLHVSETLT